jgi:dynein heavy chain
MCKTCFVGWNGVCLTHTCQESDLPTRTQILDEWGRQIDKLLKQHDMELAGDNDDSGPAAELSWWRKRVAKLTGVVEQLKGKDVRLVLGLAAAGKSRLVKRWRSMDAQITDMLNEAKDNVKYLSSLDHFIEPMHAGSITQIRDSLPGLFNNIRMMVSIARYYNHGERISRLLRRIGNQMVSGCRRCLTRKGRALEQGPAELVELIATCVAVCNEFQEHCSQLRERMVTLAKGAKHVDFDPNAVRVPCGCPSLVFSHPYVLT